MSTISQPPGIRLETEDGIAVLTLERPEIRNAIDDAMREALIAVLEQLATDETVRGLVITGAGTAFCAGGDVRGMRKRLSEPPERIAINGWRRQQRTHRAISLLYFLPKPTIAAVNGPASGLGCDLALACDFIMAAPEACFTMSFIVRGLVPDGGGMYFLPRRVGLACAKDLVFSGRTVAADEALALGLVDRLAGAATTLRKEAVAWARDLSSRSAAAIAFAKLTLNRSVETNFEQVLALGSQAQAICYTTAEHRASVEDFLNRSAKQR